MLLVFRLRFKYVCAGFLIYYGVDYFSGFLNCIFLEFFYTLHRVDRCFSTQQIFNSSCIILVG
jgi:hypothetical protein